MQTLSLQKQDDDDVEPQLFQVGITTRQNVSHVIAHLRSKHIEKFNLEMEKAAKLKEESKVQTQMSKYPNYVTPRPYLMDSYVKWTCETLQPDDFNPSLTHMWSGAQPKCAHGHGQPTYIPNFFKCPWKLQIDHNLL